MGNKVRHDSRALIYLAVMKRRRRENRSFGEEERKREGKKRNRDRRDQKKGFKLERL